MKMRITRELTDEDVVRIAKASEERKNDALQKLNSKTLKGRYEESVLKRIITREKKKIENLREKLARR